MFGKSDSEAVQDLEAAAAQVNQFRNASGGVGAIGFCSGGRQTLLFACSSDKVDAAIDCWGGFIHRATPDAGTTPARPKPILDLVGQLQCPLFGVFGEEDQNPTVAQSGGIEEARRGCRQGSDDQGLQDAGHAFRGLPPELPRRSGCRVVERCGRFF